MRDRHEEKFSQKEKSLLRRRDFLMQAGGGLGSLALTSLLADDLLAQDKTPDPLAPKAPHVKPRATSVIW
ncbi:MAG TPA: hypothetical protein PK012_34080, partial [Blastocatellia bacterium]|nr:hypothetical protein [Blastocatellia bacterium]